MPSNTTNTHENDMHSIPYILYEYERYKARKIKNRITCALCVTNIAWLIIFLAFIVHFSI